MKRYDVIIVGGGVSGSSLFYLLSRYSNVSKVLLTEQYGEIACVNSFRNNNSQTLHFGDIETNYTLEKATEVKRAADFMKKYLDSVDKKGDIHSVYDKMVLAVGKSQVKDLEKRYREFKKLFPELKLIKRKEIEKLEPNVVRGRDLKEEICALYSPNGYTVDFQRIAKSFITQGKKTGYSVLMNTKVRGIDRKEKGYIINLDGEEVFSKVVVVAAGSYSLTFAKTLGYGLDYSLLDIAGSFYLAPKMLNGKVYTMQQEKLPFAAIHGDPDVHKAGETRFGPTAKALPFLERHKYSSIFGYLWVMGFGPRVLLSFFNILSDWTIFKYLVHQFIMDFPLIGKYIFIKEVRKIVPTAKVKDLRFAKDYGGIRPQIVNLKKKGLDMGEAKIIGDEIIFNITPSPGASTCLRNAYDDSKRVAEFLGNGALFNEKRFLRDLG